VRSTGGAVTSRDLEEMLGAKLLTDPQRQPPKTLGLAVETRPMQWPNNRHAVALLAPPPRQRAGGPARFRHTGKCGGYAGQRPPAALGDGCHSPDWKGASRPTPTSLSASVRILRHSNPACRGPPCPEVAGPEGMAVPLRLESGRYSGTARGWGVVVLARGTLRVLPATAPHGSGEPGVWRGFEWSRGGAERGNRRVARKECRRT